MRESLAEILGPDTDALTLAREIVEACGDAKGQDITVLDVSSIFDLASYFVVVSGRSDRQVQGIVNRVDERLSQSGVHPISREGYEEGHWALVDYGDVVMHVFYEPVREHYDIEGLWSRARKIDLQKSEKLRSFQVHAA
jgi:ribosome-associated protein